MKMNFDKKKIAEATAGIVQKTVDTGKKVAGDTKKNVEIAIEKAKNDSLAKKVKEIESGIS